MILRSTGAEILELQPFTISLDLLSILGIEEEEKEMVECRHGVHLEFG